MLFFFFVNLSEKEYLWFYQASLSSNQFEPVRVKTFSNSNQFDPIWTNLRSSQFQTTSSSNQFESEPFILWTSSSLSLIQFELNQFKFKPVQAR